jgi:hypothetical protein
MKRYVSFVGSVLLQHIRPDLSDNERASIESNFIKLANKLGHHLCKGGHLVKVGSFSELDLAFADGAISGAKEANLAPKDYVYQLVGGPTNQNFLHDETSHLSTPNEDDFVSGRSAYITHAKAVVLLGGHHYAKMLAAWAINLGIPVFALVQAGLAGKEIWDFLIQKTNQAKSGDLIFPGVSRESYEELGIINADLDWLALRLFDMIESSSRNWVKPVALPDDMRYKPATNNVNPNTAFIAMPIGKNNSPVYEAILQSCKKAGFIGRRGDDSFFHTQDANIMSNIFESIVRSHLIIIDLSSHNPNVFYEMGVADALGKLTVLLFDGKGTPPFDIQGQRYLKYDPANPDDMIDPLTKILRPHRVNNDHH